MMAKDETVDECLSELKELFPGEFCRIRTDAEFWPAEVLSKPEETATTILIQIGFLHDVRKFPGTTLSEAMAQLYAWHSENSLCAQCCYAVDSSGLCVMDAEHRGYRPQV